MKVEIAESKHRSDTDGTPRDRWSGVTSMSAKEMRIAEKSTRASRHAGKRKSSPENPDGFTLIELLVVISILVLLMAILLPTLQQVRKQAKGSACQAKLRQWGLVFSMYMNEHNDQFINGEGTSAPGRWMSCARPYYGNVDGLFLCPMAPRYELNKNDPKWEGNLAAGCGVGSKFTAWKSDLGPWSQGTKRFLYGGYGWNFFVPMTYSAQALGLKMLPAPPRSLMPFLLVVHDSCTWG